MLGVGAEPQFIHCGHLLNYRCYQKQHLSACEERIAEEAGYVGSLCLHRQTHAPAHSLELSKVVEAFLAYVTIVSKKNKATKYQNESFFLLKICIFN